jgi:plasmid stabilization system protein ParE
MKGAFALTPSASRDIDDIFDYVLEHSGPDRALSVHARLFEACSKIASQPSFVGHARDDLADESLRVLPILSFLVIFRPQTRPVEIVRIIHGARDLKRALEE